MKMHLACLLATVGGSPSISGHPDTNEAFGRGSGCTETRKAGFGQIMAG